MVAGSMSSSASNYRNERFECDSRSLYALLYWMRSAIPDTTLPRLSFAPWHIADCETLVILTPPAECMSTSRLFVYEYSITVV